MSLEDKPAKKVAKIQRKLTTIATVLRAFQEEGKEAPRLEEIFQIRMPAMPEHDKIIETLNNDFLAMNAKLVKLVTSPQSNSDQVK